MRSRCTQRRASCCTRVTGSSTSPRSTGRTHRSRPPRPAHRRRRRPAADGRLDQRRGARLRAERDDGRCRCCSRCSSEHRGRRIITASFASHLHRIQQIADAAIADGRKVATLGLSMKKNVRLGRDLGVIDIPESSLIDIEDIDDYAPGPDLRDLDRFAGRADVGAVAAGPRREQVRQARRARHGDPVEPRDPRQRERGQQGDRRAAAARRRGRSTPACSTCTPPVTPRPTRSRPTCRWSSPSGSCRSTASSATWWPTPDSAS